MRNFLEKCVILLIIIVVLFVINVKYPNPKAASKYDILPPLQPFVNNIRTAFDYKLSFCLIEKSMSSVLASILCLLHAKDDYLKANGTVLCGGWHCNYGKTKNEYDFLEEIVLKTNTHLSDWTLFAVVRDPIERFLSGFVHKCINKQEKCYGCYKNLACVLRNIYKRSRLYLQRKHGYLTTDDRHFFPQNWRCQFQYYMKYYQIIHYQPYHSKGYDKMLKQINEILYTKKVPAHIVNFIIDELKHNLSRHATMNSPDRQKYAQELKDNQIAQQYFMKIFYHDFLLFNFTIPYYFI